MTELKLENYKVSVDQYGRKQWNEQAYAAEAKRRKKNPQDKPSNEHLINPEKSSSYLNHRQDVYTQVTNSVKKFTIVNPLGNYGKQKTFGFLCPICDLSYRDNLGLIDHLNSPQHLKRVKDTAKSDTNDTQPEIDGVKRATVDDVRATIEQLVQKDLAAEQPGLSISERIERRKQFEQQQLEKRRQKRRQRKKTVQLDDDTEVLKLMGFKNFGDKK